MKKIILPILIALMAIPGLASNTSQSVSPAININNDSVNQYEVDTDGDYIVYTQKNESYNELYLYNIEKKETKLITQQAEVGLQPSIDAGRIVYVEAKKWNKKIVLYDIATDTKTDITNPQNYLHDVQPQLQGDKISFVRWWYSSNKSTAYIYDMKTKEATSIDSKTSTWQTNISHYGNMVAWQDNRNEIDEIFLHNLITKETINLSNNGLTHYFPKVSNKYIAWQSKDSIYIKDLDTGNLLVVGSDMYSNYNLDISGDNVVYQSWRNGNCDIYLYNITSQIEIRLTSGWQTDEEPKLDNTLLVWRQKKNDDTYDVMYKDIKTIIESAYTQLSFESITANSVKISWPKISDKQYASYNLYRSITEDARGELLAYQIRTNTYTDTNLVAKKNYYYSLYIVDQFGNESSLTDQFTYQANNKKLVKLANSPSVYVIDGNDYYVISNETIFNLYGFKWQDISLTSKSELDSHHYNGALKYPNGSLLKATNSTIYLVDENMIKPFSNSETFTRGGYKWNNIHQVTPGHLDLYNLGDSLTVNNFKHPNGTLITYYGNRAVFLIENGQKRLIPNDSIFNSLGFDWNNVVVSPSYWQYPDGPSL